MKFRMSPWKFSLYMLLGISAGGLVLFLWQVDFQPATAIGNSVGGFLVRPFFSIGSLDFTLAFLVKMTMYLVALGLATSLTKRAIGNRILSRTALDKGQKYAFGRIGGYLVFLIGLIVGLESIGVKLDSLLVFGGTVGIGIGLGLQDLANNFVSGLVLIFERTVKLGDRIDVGGVAGDVERLAARSTWVRTNENVVIIVPNAEFISKRVTNWTANDRTARFSIPVGVSYDSEPDRVREILLDVARQESGVLASPLPDVLFLGFGESSLNFELRVWTSEYVQMPKVLSSHLYFAIFRALRENQIEIPFPQRDLHLRSTDVPMALSAGQG